MEILSEVAKFIVGRPKIDLIVGTNKKIFALYHFAIYYFLRLLKFKLIQFFETTHQSLFLIFKMPELN